MAGSGWQFSVTVPSWTQATLEGDENVVVCASLHKAERCLVKPTSSCMAIVRVYHSLPVCPQFYRVEVKVLPPEADAAPKTRSVLRRFSHFTKLYAKVSLNISAVCLQCNRQEACLVDQLSSSSAKMVMYPNLLALHHLQYWCVCS